MRSFGWMELAVDDSVAPTTRSVDPSPWRIQEPPLGATTLDVERLNGLPDYARFAEWFYVGRQGDPGLRVTFVHGNVRGSDELPPSWCAPPKAEAPAAE